MGEVFAGRYELIDPIGRGGVGAVWRAWDQRRRRYVAAKVLQQSDAHTLLRFVREQALRIEHPHVLAPASWAADDDKVLFTMDLVSGGSLAHVIGDYGPLPPRFVCLLLDQLLSGLSTVHAEGVVHRDIKPANILMEATGSGRPHLRLSDFGISMRKGEPRLTETNYVVGTPGYFAPEQMMGAEPDFPADLFAVGLVALYLLQGKKPDSQALVEHFAAHGTPGAPDGIPEPLWQVLAGLLQPDPQARFRTATGARKALTAAVEMLPEPGLDDEPVEVFDQIGPLPAGFGPDGPVKAPQASGAPQPPVSPPPPVSMSETGSFHLAPPPQQQPQQQPQQPEFHQPTSASTPVATPPPPPAPLPAQPAAPSPSPYAVGAPDPSQAPTSGVPYDASATRPYTAQQQQHHQHQQPLAAHAAHAPAHAPAASPAPVPVRQTRPGPPPKVAVPVLVVALICFAVGIWALTQM
ncbi:serine/threonine-protein kinase [Streptomyces cyaneofuscatus]|uniref:serine/threonine-protein kinase n=1 Tax=Streptomyces cyaneofuscatus TaxID=66883 RepID=UPI0036598960